jgi:thiaminase/transcriptional activator TenA
VSLAQRLWVDNAELAARALAHPFVRGVADGSLPGEVFSGYVAQDAFFLEAFARAYALALAASPDIETVLAFAGLIAGVRDELSMHAADAARGEWTPQQPPRPKRLWPTPSFCWRRRRPAPSGWCAQR